MSRRHLAKAAAIGGMWQMVAAATDSRASGGTQLDVRGFDDLNYARLFREETGITFLLLADEQRLAYRAAGLRTGNLLHLFRADNARARSRARAAAQHQQGLGRNRFPLGGGIVFGPGSVDLFAPLSNTFGDNASPDALLAAIPRPGVR